METNMQVSLQNVVKKYEKTSIALDASFGFQKGRITGLLGHNGAGKTTAIRIILGLIRADSGMTLWHTDPITDKDRAHIGYMPETLRMPRNLNCLEILEHQCALFDSRKTEKPKTSARERARVALANIGLLDHKSKLVHSLSKGMGRKLAWAAATISNPQVLILDEPFSGLDPYGRVLMEEWIQSLMSKGSTIVLSTHDLHQAGRLCDDVIVLKKGKVVYTKQTMQGTVSSGKNPYRLSIKGVTEKEMSQVVQGVFGQSVHVSSHGYAHEVHCNTYEVAASVAQNVLSKGWVLSEMAQIKDQLESEIRKFFISEDSMEAS